jgi:hypothetical protein
MLHAVKTRYKIISHTRFPKKRVGIPALDIRFVNFSKIEINIRFRSTPTLLTVPEGPGPSGTENIVGVERNLIIMFIFAKAGTPYLLFYEAGMQSGYPYPLFREVGMENIL